MSVNNYSYSAAGFAMTKKWEGLRLTSYQDIRGIWTVGYGHVDRNVVRGLVITSAQADALLRADISRAVTFVNEHVTVRISQNQFDALVDFAFNLGTANLISSTLLRKLNAGDFAGAAAEFPKWDHAGSVANGALLERRDDEQHLFLNAAADIIEFPSNVRFPGRVLENADLFLEAA